MKKFVQGLAIAGVALATQVSAQPAQIVDGAMSADVVTVKAKVNAVDLAKREVTVTGPLGRTVVLKVDERVKNLPQVKAGDELVLKYAEAVSLDVRKGGDAGREKVVTTTAPVTAPAGAKPGVAAARQERLTANIEQLDAKRQVALVQGPGGRYVEVKVKDPAVFKSLAVNDKVDVTFTEAVLIEVVPPAAKK
jgi:hypothetical protein